MQYFQRGVCGAPPVSHIRQAQSEKGATGYSDCSLLTSALFLQGLPAALRPTRGRWLLESGPAYTLTESVLVTVLPPASLIVTVTV